MNVRKPVNYGTMYRELAAILAQNLPQMEEVYAIGKVINQRPEKGAAVAAAEFMQANFPDHTGFSPRNVRRMRDFYRTYENDQTLLRLAMKIGWTLNVVIMEAELTRDARKWYLEQAQGQHWSKKELVEMIRRKESRDEVNGKYEKAQKSMVYRRIVADTTPSPQGCVIGCALRVVIFCDIMTKNSLCAGGIPVDTIKEKLLTRIDERLFEYTHSIPCLCCGDRIDIFHHRRNHRKCHTGDAGWSSNIPNHHRNTSRGTCPSQQPRRSPGKFLPNHIHPTTYRYCCAGRTYLLRSRIWYKHRAS